MTDSAPVYCHYNAVCAFFAAQVLFSFTAMIFCMAMIVDNRDTSVFLPILTSVISVWMPAPVIPKKKPRVPIPAPPTP